jgi:hypothetical protein
MVFPSVSSIYLFYVFAVSRILGRDRLVFVSIGNAAQDGKRLRVMDASQ